MSCHVCAMSLGACTGTKCLLPPATKLHSLFFPLPFLLFKIDYIQRQRDITNTENQLKPSHKIKI